MIMAAKKKETGKGLYKKRYATLKEHRAAVAARKALKGGKNVGPVANADAYGEQIKKKKPPVAKPATKSTTKPSAQANKGTGRDGKFGTGTYGSGRPSDKPAVKTKATTTRHRGGQRSRPGNRETVKARQERRRQGAREVSNRARLANPGASLPMRPAKNPSKGHRYKKPFGPTMVYDGTKYVRAK